MPYIPFVELFPLIAKKETKLVIVLDNSDTPNLPLGEYIFVKLFCNECDCRSVFLKVIKAVKEVALIAYQRSLLRSLYCSKVNYFRNIVHEKN